MSGWVEWLLFTIAMVVGGIGILILFMNPLLVLIAGALFAFVSWVSAPPESEARRTGRRSPNQPGAR